MSDKKKSKEQEKMAVVSEVNTAVGQGVEEVMEQNGVKLFDQISAMDGSKGTFTLKVNYDLSKDPLEVTVDLDLTIKNKIQGHAERVIDLNQTSFEFTQKPAEAEEEDDGDPKYKLAQDEPPAPAPPPKAKKGKKK